MFLGGLPLKMDDSIVRKSALLRHAARRSSIAHWGLVEDKRVKDPKP